LGSGDGVIGGKALVICTGFNAQVLLTEQRSGQNLEEASLCSAGSEVVQLRSRFGPNSVSATSCDGIQSVLRHGYCQGGGRANFGPMSVKFCDLKSKLSPLATRSIRPNSILPCGHPGSVTTT
jgi:hypothetical protein